ncbi:hypothetical protein WOC76_07445 [Methylocystis sp. IM3]
MVEAVASFLSDALGQTPAPPQSRDETQSGVAAHEAVAALAREAAAPEDASGKKIVEIRITLDSDDGALLKILSALDPQRQPESALNPRFDLPVPARDDALAPKAQPERGRRRSLISPLAILAALLIGLALRISFKDAGFPTTPMQPLASMKQMIDQIVATESHGDAAAKNPHSTALGVGQFVEATWLGLVKKHRPDIANGLNDRQILDLRKDPELSRFMASRYAEENTSLLARRGLPVTPGSLYLAHFAGPAGAAAILTAPEGADAAAVIANTDARPNITREKIVNGNPFMKKFTAKDLKNWADLKMQGLDLVAGGPGEKGGAGRD